MTDKLRVPFTFYGFVEIDCSIEEYEASDLTPLYERAEKELEHVELLNELDFDGFDFTSAEWLEEE